MTDQDQGREFVLAYAALCKKYGLCIVPEDRYVCLYVAEYGDGDWVEAVALSEGVEIEEVRV